LEIALAICDGVLQISITVSTFEPKLNDAVKALADGLRARATQLLASATSLSSTEQSELNSLASRKELAANLDAVLAEIDRKRRIAAYSQCTADTNTLAMNVKQRLGVLRNRWQAANKLYTKGDPDEYEGSGRELYGLLRESWERGVSEVLLNDVVERYRPSIETKKVAPLHDITEADCKAVVTGMTESSRWIRGHDGAIADGSPFPKSDELKGRIDELDAWIEGIRKRRKK